GKKPTAPNPTSLSPVAPSFRPPPPSLCPRSRSASPSPLAPRPPSLALSPAAPSFLSVTGGTLLPSRCTRTSLPLPALLPPPLQLGFRLPNPQSPKLGSSNSSDGGRGRSSPRSSTSRPSVLAALAGDCLRGDDDGLVIPGDRGAPQGRPPPHECSGCTHEFDLDKPPVLQEVADFFSGHGIEDFTFSRGRLSEWQCRAK
uniref:Uncharacterized protein n=2 Tax=Aegilops tauschii subsp. strangulata TaxID=200361 RepID=A0A453B032_AEGTS